MKKFSEILESSSAYNHRIIVNEHSIRMAKAGRPVFPPFYVAWTQDSKQGRLRNPVEKKRGTDLVGAKKFNKKWNINFDFSDYEFLTELGY
jgi:hypothetical protein